MASITRDVLQAACEYGQCVAACHGGQSRQTADSVLRRSERSDDHIGQFHGKTIALQQQIGRREGARLDGFGEIQFDRIDRSRSRIRADLRQRCDHRRGLVNQDREGRTVKRNAA